MLVPSDLRYRNSKFTALLVVIERSEQALALPELSLVNITQTTVPTAAAAVLQPQRMEL
jgi:hypothetical protein